MSRTVHAAITLLICICVLDLTALGDCTPKTVSGPTLVEGPNGTTAGCPYTGASDAPDVQTLNKVENRTIGWPDGTQLGVTASSHGDCRLYYPNCHLNLDLGFCTTTKWLDPSSYCYRQYWECWPEFWPPDYFS